MAELLYWTNKMTSECSSCICVSQTVNDSKSSEDKIRNNSYPNLCRSCHVI